jgi:flagellar hook-basal body complex protein FliE
VNKLQAVQHFSPLQQSKPEASVKTEKTNTNFQEMFSKALNEVNNAQKESDKLTNKLITGEEQDIHQVMIASQKASLSLQLTTQVRNKVVEAYQEVMRMQV